MSISISTVVDLVAPLHRAPLAAALLLAAGAALLPRLAAADEEARPDDYTRKVAIYLYEGVELLDFAGPGEVFAAAAGFGASGDRPAFEVYTVARTAEPITSQGFLEVVPDHGIDTAPEPDVLVLPGGGTRAVLADPAAMAWIEKSARGAEAALTVCTGAFMLAEAGLLDGLDVTTWYGALDRLASRYPKARVQPGRRFVDSGSVITTAGVSAGIDGALHLVARLLGRDVAERTAQYMEYGWTPEAYLADGYPDDNPSLDERGRAVAAADALRDRRNWPAAARAYRALVEADPADGRSWYFLAYALHAAGDLEAAIPAHRRAAEFDDRRAAALYNLACALALRGDTDEALATLAAAVDAGFRDKGLLASDEELASVRDSPRFAEIAARL